MTPEDQLEFCLQEVAAGRKTIAECVALFPETPGLETRLTVAQALKVWSAVDLDSGTYQHIERQVRAHVRRQPAAWPNRFWGAWTAPLRVGSRKFGVAAGLAVILTVSLLGGGGLVHAASEALPGDVLYAVKTTVETTRLALATSEMEVATLRLAFSEQRLDEAEALLKVDRAVRVSQTLEAYTTEVQAVITALEHTTADPAAQAARHQAQAALEVQSGRLGKLNAQMPPQAQMAFDQAARVSSQALATLGGSGAPATQPDLTATVEVTRPKHATTVPAGLLTATWTVEPTATSGTAEVGSKKTHVPQPTPNAKPTHSTHPEPAAPAPGPKPGHGSGQPEKQSATPKAVPTPKH